MSGLWSWIKGLFGYGEKSQNSYPKSSTEENTQSEAAEPQKDSEEQPWGRESDRMLARKSKHADKTQPIERLEGGFNRLIDQLEVINQNLKQQVSQHEQLASRVNKVPEMLENLPGAIEKQQSLTEQLLEEVKRVSAKEQQFVEFVERIPEESARQTDALGRIEQQLAVAADSDVQMTEGFNKFNETLGKLNESTRGQSENISQMNKTFTAGERYLQYMLSRQSKRFTWLLIASLGISLFVILVLVGIIIWLNR